MLRCPLNAAPQLIPPASLSLVCAAAGAGQGSVQGVSGLSTAEKAFNCLNALGSIGFACEPPAVVPATHLQLWLCMSLLCCRPLRPRTSYYARAAPARPPPLHPHPACAATLPPTLADSVSNVLMEITDTMRQPPSAVAQMKRAVNIALSVAFTFYCGVAVLGYASLGDATPSLVLSGFTGESAAGAREGAAASAE